MNILAIETSTPHASVCLMRGAAYEACSTAACTNCTWEAERNHDAYLFPALGQALEQLGDETLDLILVGAGPGSYGGIRVALAAADGIALVRHAPVVSLCSWLCLAAPAQETWIISDAKRGGWTFARFSSGSLIDTIDVLAQQELLRKLSDSPEIAISTETEETLRAKGIPGVTGNCIPTAAGLVEAWRTLPEEERKKHLNAPPSPIYVRPPHITEAKRKPWESRK